MNFKEYTIGEYDTEEQKKFRKEVGEWLDKNISPELIKGTNELRVTAYIPGQHEFAVKLGSKGWLVPEWPKDLLSRVPSALRMFALILIQA